MAIHNEEKHMKDNHKTNIEGNTTGAKIRAFIAGLTSSMIFKYTFLSTVIVALAAGILYHTATDSKHVKIDKVNTACVVLNGARGLGEIGPGECASLRYGIKRICMRWLVMIVILLAVGLR